jgi:predicted transcriptional regulator
VPKPPHIELTEGEWAIMNAVWQLEPCTAPAIQEALQSSRAWTYSTVRTLMDRMVAKGLLASEKLRNLTVYRALATSEQAQRGEVLYALTHAFSGALTPMVQCLLDSGDVDADALAALERLIRERRKKAR